MGRQLLEKCTTELLVQVDAAAKKAADSWLQQAGTAGERIREASQPHSQLKEDKCGGVQELFSALLLSSASPGQQLRVHDVHLTTSVCRSLKPDIIVTAGPYKIPNSTVLVLDLKRQDGGYNGPANIHQVRLARCDAGC
jgi:hypothetical protein